MLQHFAAGHVLAYHGPRGPVAVMECISDAVAQREADRRNEYARAAQHVARLRLHDVHPLVYPRREPERMYGPEFGDFAD